MDTAVNILKGHFSKIWKEGKVPAEWKECIIIKLPKKEDIGDYNNYRGIMFLSMPGKVLNLIILQRMKDTVDTLLRDQQDLVGFRRNRSCADQKATLRIIVEQSSEWNSPSYINFIDFEKAFDSVDREALWKHLAHYGVPSKIIRLIQCTYSRMDCKVAHACRPTIGELYGRDRGTTGVLAVTFPIPPSDRLNHEDNYRRQEE